MPNAAMLDAYDAAVLANTASEAPTFDEVAEPRDEQPRRFRGWLGWTGPVCAPCPAGDDAHCPSCGPPLPYICARPGRVRRCDGEDLVSMTVANGDDAIPASGVYVLEGGWRSAAPGEPVFAVTKVEAIHLPEPAPPP
jgi:hypothetical protein